MIVSIPKNDAFTWTTMNIGWAEIIGADLKFRGHWAVGGVRIGTLLNYTFQKTHTLDRTIGVEFYGDPLPYIPEHSGTVVLGVRWKKWQFNYSFIYTGERYAISAATPENYVRPWYTHDISASRAIRLGSTELKAAAEINNIFNQQYEVVKRFPMPGTNFKVIISIML